MTGSGWGRPRRIAARCAAAAAWVVLAAAIGLLWPPHWGGIGGATIVVGHSMEPTYATGDMLLTYARSDLEVGDVIVASGPPGTERAGKPVVHRIVRISPEGISTKGDNNAHPDPWTVTGDQITGEVWLRIPGAGSPLLSGRGRMILGAVLAAVLGAWVAGAPRRQRPAANQADGEDAAQDLDAAQ